MSLRSRLALLLAGAAVLAGCAGTAGTASNPTAPSADAGKDRITQSDEPDSSKRARVRMES